MSAQDHLSGPQFFHGSSSRKLKPGDLVDPNRSDRVYEGGKKYAFFTSSRSTGRSYGRNYRVEPTGPYEADPNFGDSGIAFRSEHPLRIVSHK